MKQRFGAVLCMILGTVLITTGLGGTVDAVGGDGQPTCQTQAAGVNTPCPTGTITVNETTIAVPGATAEAPAGGWTVQITSSNCTLPNGQAVDITLTIPDGGSATTSSLFIYTDPRHATSCSFVLAPQAEVGFTSTLLPPSPVTITFDGEINNAQVELTETPAAPSTVPVSSIVPSSSTAPSSSAAASDTAVSSSSAAASSVAVTATTAPLADTGTRTQVTFSLWLGLALFALGFVLLLAGRGPKRGAHRNG